jgi:hypothetical protein
MCQTDDTRYAVKDFIYCLDRHVDATSQEFEFPDDKYQFLVRKLVVVMYLRNGEVASLDQIGIGLESKIGENTVMEIVGSPCSEMFEKVEPNDREGTKKIIRVYEYFLEGPKKYFSLAEKQKIVKDYFQEEVKNELEKLMKSEEVLDVSYQLLSVGYPKF